MRGVVLQSIGGVKIATRFDLEVHFWERERGTITGSIVYNTDLFESGTIKWMARYIERLLKEMVKKPQGRLSELEMLSIAEREQLIDDFNADLTST
jgi:non-ribosomal peptide synthetase component F